jgi:hypothetical protein
MISQRKVRMTSKYFVLQHKYFIIAYDEIDFLVNKKLSFGWSKILNEKNISTFY